eukprot:snap_masked-scaffold_46-processed-gene-1.7-mRNA-1 protein AED:1.00 eAED:1.00 QI:0/0/0/0/1/1/2/0/109
MRPDADLTELYIGSKGKRHDAEKKSRFSTTPVAQNLNHTFAGETAIEQPSLRTIVLDDTNDTGTLQKVTLFTFLTLSIIVVTLSSLLIKERGKICSCIIGFDENSTLID